MAFPLQRPRRLRNSSALRGLVQETDLSAAHLIAPLFICEGRAVRREVASMPGVFQMSADVAAEEAQALHQLGVPAVLLFGVPGKPSKDDTGSEAWNPDGLVQRTAQAVKRAVPGLLLIADTCFCEYTSHGHCGVLTKSKGVDNDLTLENLGRAAVSQARAGADIIAPSGMMDGMVQAIRAALDREHFSETAVMAYSVKYSSGFYGPFRDAADSAPAFGDRRQYQMDYHNVREGLREARLDVEEGADIIMVKPALAFLDVIRAVRETVDVPVCAYSVSGEYSMVKAAAKLGWLDETRAVNEIIGGIRRAGADMVITYWAGQIARQLRQP